MPYSARDTKLISNQPAQHDQPERLYMYVFPISSQRRKVCKDCPKEDNRGGGFWVWNPRTWCCVTFLFTIQAGYQHVACLQLLAINRRSCSVITAATYKC